MVPSHLDFSDWAGQVSPVTPDHYESVTIDVHICMCIYIYIQRDAYIYIYICVHIYIYTHMYISNISRAAPKRRAPRGIPEGEGVGARGAAPQSRHLNLKTLKP